MSFSMNIVPGEPIVFTIAQTGEVAFRSDSSMSLKPFLKNIFTPEDKTTLAALHNFNCNQWRKEGEAAISSASGVYSSYRSGVYQRGQFSANPVKGFHIVSGVKFIPYEPNKLPIDEFARKLIGSTTSQNPTSNNAAAISPPGGPSISNQSPPKVIVKVVEQQNSDGERLITDPEDKQTGGCCGFFS